MDKQRVRIFLDKSEVIIKDLDKTIELLGDIAQILRDYNKEQEEVLWKVATKQ